MNLVVDVGNSFSKIAIFKGTQLLLAERFDNRQIVIHYERLKKEYPDIKQGIVSNVGHLDDALLAIIEKEIPIHRLTSDSKLPFDNGYKTPLSLGVDRMALVSAAVIEFPNKNALIIDAGTCITYDFVDKHGYYFGGAISPGLRIRYESLHDFTAKLPLLEPEVPEDLTGDSTRQSIHSGVVTGACKEIDGFIEAYKLRHTDLTVILTGGDAKFLSDQLKNSIFANSNFLLIGLNYLLDFNIKA